MTGRRSNEPFFWSLFSGGGMVAALTLPAIAILLWIAIPLGVLPGPTHERLTAVVGHPLTRAALLGVIVLSLFHWGHRFRFTLYDGLQLHHLFGLIATICYGGAALLSLAAAYLLWSF